MSSVDDSELALKAQKEKLIKAANTDFGLAKVIMKGFRTTGIAIAVWFWGYLGMSVAWVFVMLFFHIVSQEVGRQIKSKKKFALQSMTSEKKAILSRVDDHQSWVYFPELEKAEWVNKMIKQLWPMIAEYAENLIMTTIQDCIQAYMPSNLGEFKFTHVDLGDIPMRVEWVNVYVNPEKKNEVILDMKIKYQGDSSIKCEVKGISFGIKSLEIDGHMRVVMNPLISDIPIVGGLSAFFLNPPTINFDMLAAANILDLPFIKSTVKDIVSKVVCDILVLPRRIPISLHPDVDISKIRHPPADGLVIVHVVEGKDLKAADVGLVKKAKSDPFCSVKIGNQVMKTKTVQSTLNPHWNEFFQAVIDQRHGQEIAFNVWDKDSGAGADDDLGDASLDIELISKKGKIDVWLPLSNVATGSVHVRALWMDACSVIKEFKPTTSVMKSRFANAILLVVVESATGMPESENTGKVRSPYVKLQLAGEEKSTSIKNNTKDPNWSENFNFFLSDPQNQQLDMRVMHKGSSKELQLARVVVPMNAVLLSKNLVLEQKYSLPEISNEASLTVRFVLKILKTTVEPEKWADFSALASVAFNQPTLASEIQDVNSGRGLLNMDFGELDDLKEEAPKEEEQVEDVVVSSDNARGDEVKEDKPLIKEDPSPPNVEPIPVKEEPIPLKEETAPMMSSSYHGEADEAKTTIPASPSLHSAFASSILDSHQKPPSKLGQIQLTIRYSSSRSTLVLVVHQCKNLIPCDKDNLADPYVRVYLLPDRSSDTKRKTKIVKNNLNPIFDESFEWVLGNMELPFRSLEVGVKNDTGMFSRSREKMGMVVIKLNQVQNPSQPLTQWFDLEEGN